MKAAAPLSVVAIMAASAVAITDFNPANSLGRLSPDNSLGRVHAARAHARRAASGKQYKRCKAKSTGSEPAPTPAPAPAPASTPASTPEPATSSKSYEGGSSGGSGGTINVQTSGCGDIGAVSETNKYAGPNGSEDWLTCGIKSGGWNPPFITVGDLKFKDLGAEFASGNSIFKPCAQFSDAINSAAKDYGLPSIMIASIMMQESSCNKDTVGGGGEQGLMQITHEKCGGAPNGDCKEPWYNIHTGAKYLSDQINNNGGNVLLALGSYNGWYKGLTYDKATAAAHTDCCRCQNNLDYPHQFLNGWMQGKDAYSSDLGTYKNLEVCF